MKLPADFHRITVLQNLAESPYPINFLPFIEGNSGAGDYYGLYWPLEKTQQEPLVCYYDHEAHLLVAQYRNLTEFLANIPASPTLADESFFENPFLKAKLLAKKGRPEESIHKLRISTALFTEFADSWSLLAEQLMLQQQLPEAALAARQAIIANWHFGYPDALCIQLFNELPVPAHLAEDPLFKLRATLFKPQSANHQFKVDAPRMWAIVRDYIQQNDCLTATRLAQNCLYVFSRNTQAVQTVSQFNETEWRAKLLDLQKHLNA